MGLPHRHILRLEAFAKTRFEQKLAKVAKISGKIERLFGPATIVEAYMQSDQHPAECAGNEVPNHCQAFSEIGKTSEFAI
jgi:hypothetical protein